MPAPLHPYSGSAIHRWRGTDLDERLQSENTSSCLLVDHGGGEGLHLAALKLRASLAVKRKVQATRL